MNLHRTIWRSLVNRSSAIQMSLYPLLSGSPTMKSIQRSCQGTLGMGLGYKMLNGNWCEAFALQQGWQFRTYRYTFFYIPGQKYSLVINSGVLERPGWLVAGASWAWRSTCRWRSSVVGMNRLHQNSKQL